MVPQLSHHASFYSQKYSSITCSFPSLHKGCFCLLKYLPLWFDCTRFILLKILKHISIPGTILCAIILRTVYWRFVRSEDNHADIFTKNLNIETFGKHYQAMGLEDENLIITSKMRNRKGFEVDSLVFPHWTWVRTYDTYDTIRTNIPTGDDQILEKLMKDIIEMKKKIHMNIA